MLIDLLTNTRLYENSIVMFKNKMIFEQIWIRTNWSSHWFSPGLQMDLCKIFNVIFALKVVSNADVIHFTPKGLMKGHID